MKEKITTYIFVGYLLLFSLMGVILKDKDISITERRRLASFPKFAFNSEYVTKLDKYFLDHYPYRDTFRSIKAKYNFYVLNKLDNNNIYLKDNYIFKSLYPTNKNSINNFVKHINSISSMFDGNNKYVMIIPDKNYYLDDDMFLNLDYDYIYDNVSSLNTFIDIRDLLMLDDYYETDTHWRQERIDKVVKRMSIVMGFDYKDIEYKENTFDNFYGVYYGESAIDREPEKLVYLTNEILDMVEVEYYENANLSSVYNSSKLDGLDAYDVYLDGASSFIEITNNNVSDRELIIFRDSFGSSITPLLIPYYSKITVIDNRYINSNYFKDMIDNSENADILFLYSTLLVNESGSLKN